MPINLKKFRAQEGWLFDNFSDSPEILVSINQIQLKDWKT